jgi:hypothetical protein
MNWSQISAGATDLFWNVAGNIIADLLVIIFIALIGYLSRSRIKALIKSLQFATRMRKNGISNFYNNRQDYVTARPERSLGEYMLRCRRRFLYVGFYLAGATERDRIDSVLSTLLERGCEIELVLLDPDAPRETIREVERHLAVPNGTLQQLLRHAHDHFRKLRSRLSVAAQNRFAIKLHQEALSSSAMLLDEGEPDGRMLVDNKIHQAGRDRSFGIEFVLNGDEKGLAEDFALSFKRIAEAAH